MMRFLEAENSKAKNLDSCTCTCIFRARFVFKLRSSCGSNSPHQGQNAHLPHASLLTLGPITVNVTINAKGGAALRLGAPMGLVEVTGVQLHAVHPLKHPERHKSPLTCHGISLIPL